MATLGKLVVTLTAQTRPLQRGLKQADRYVGAFSKSLGRATLRLGRLGLQATKWGALIAAGLGAAMIKLAMDAEESESLFETSMGRMADDARRWSEVLGKSLGLSTYAMRRNVASLHVMLKGLGQGEAKSLEMSKALVKLAADLGSFYNLPTEQAFERLRSGLIGEAEPLRRLNVFLTAARTKSLAFTRGIAAQGDALTEGQKVAARYLAIMKDTEVAQGDLRRTGASASNQLRGLKNRVLDVGRNMGEFLLPRFTDMVTAANRWVTANESLITQTFGDWVKEVQTSFASVPDWWRREGKTLFQSVVDDMSTLIGAVKKAKLVAEGLMGVKPKQTEEERLFERRADVNARLRVVQQNAAKEQAQLSKDLDRAARARERKYGSVAMFWGVVAGGGRNRLAALRADALKLSEELERIDAQLGAITRKRGASIDRAKDRDAGIRRGVMGETWNVWKGTDWFNEMTRTGRALMGSWKRAKQALTLQPAFNIPDTTPEMRGRGGALYAPLRHDARGMGREPATEKGQKDEASLLKDAVRELKLLRAEAKEQETVTVVEIP